MTRWTVAGAVTGAMVLVTIACAPARPRLPQGPWAPAPDAIDWFADAASGCASVRTLTAEIAVSGRAAGNRIRGRLIAGLERPGSLRLEAPAPFGAPVFILAASGDRAVLYFPRDARVLAGAGVSDVLEALAGIRRGAADLHALLTGCLVADRRPSGGLAAGDGWAQVDLGRGVAAYLRRRAGRWSIVGGRQAAGGAAGFGTGWSVEYADVVGGFPRTVLFSTGTDRDGGAGRAATTLTFRLSQLEANVPVDPAAFALDIPAGTYPLTLDELRQMGPLADRDAEKR